MKYIILSIVVLFSSAAIAKTPVVDKVAQYSIGKRGSANFELIAFYTKKGRYHSKIEYTYGKNDKRVSLRYLGKVKVRGQAAFKVKFSNNYTLVIIPQKNLSLKIRDNKGRYSKTFGWHYEGPIEGRGTFCSVCADDEVAAMKIINNHYLRKP